MADEMQWFKDIIQVQTRGKGLYPFTDQITQRIRQWQVRTGGDVLPVLPAYQRLASDKRKL